MNETDFWKLFWNSWNTFTLTTVAFKKHHLNVNGAFKSFSLKTWKQKECTPDRQLQCRFVQETRDGGSRMEACVSLVAAKRWTFWVHKWTQIHCELARRTWAMSRMILYLSWRVPSWGAFNQSPDQQTPNLQTVIPTVAFKHGRGMETPVFLKSVNAAFHSLIAGLSIESISRDLLGYSGQLPARRDFCIVSRHSEQLSRYLCVRFLHIQVWGWVLRESGGMGGGGWHGFKESLETADRC